MKCVVRIEPPSAQHHHWCDHQPSSLDEEFQHLGVVRNKSAGLEGALEGSKILLLPQVTHLEALVRVQAKLWAAGAVEMGRERGRGREEAGQ